MPSGWYVYAILPADSTLPAGLRGFHGAPVSVVRGGEVAAATSPIERGPPSASPARLLEHEATVEAVRRASPALPARFGTIFPTVEALAHALEARSAVLAADLARLGDAVELGLTVLEAGPARGDAAPAPDESDPATEIPERLRHAAGPGARYLAARAARYGGDTRARDEARRMEERMERALGPYAVESRYTPRPAPRLVLRAAYLVAPSRVEAFRTAVEELRRSSSGGIRLLVAGPWPPYSFVTAAGEPTIPGLAGPFPASAG